ncbi:uncharacterized protein Dwil_GK26974 [Drosophila willistoni]|uniref:Peptidase S1 domain-containing protein n=2 Tax=Drosophila willistoni TaxID=7260 RepID=A0A0Q9X0S3_DROWI|nr:uncharacterized protein Dwil_GK26974 [Drosophila willistoni]
MASDHLYRYQKTKPTTTRIPQVSAIPEVPLDHYVVRLMKEDQLVCSGIIVNQHQVLTATTCSAVTSGLVVKLYDGSTYTVTDHIPGKGYSIGVGVELLTLLNLNTTLEDAFSRAPSICSHRLAMGEIVQLWTWNSRKTGLRKKRVSQIPDRRCKQIINDPEMLVLSNATSCLSNTAWSKTCQPNIGLPYVYKQSFCGLNILGHNCPKASEADVYIRLLDEKRFISEKMNQVRLARLDRFLI